MKARLDNTMDLRQALAGACARLLALSIAFLHSVLRTDWLRLVDSPSVAAGVFCVIPATWLAIREHCFGAERRRHARLRRSVA